MRHQVTLIALVAAGLASLSTAQNGSEGTGPREVSQAAARGWPDTTRGVHVFVDQLPAGMTDAQIRFAATHYAGTQKMLRAEADRLRAVSPAFLILHYRLGLGLGYRAPDPDCNPTGEFIAVIDGDRWVQEWPGDTAVRENWFFHWPAGSASRVYSCDWGWYTAELDDPGWRRYWHDEVLRQIRANDADGAFMDSVSVPNYLGADRFKPSLPDVDESFESSWARRIADWLRWLQGQDLGSYLIVPNVGAWINGRDATDYSGADGLMVEGFALEADASPLAFSDWQLQMDRCLGAIRAGQALLAQTYIAGDQERMAALGSYLLVKGEHTFLAIETADEPEWWPEYDVPVGAPLGAPPATITDLDPDGDSIYRRDFENAVVLVNPTNPWDGSAVTRTIQLGRALQQVQLSGGGVVGEDGTTDAAVTTTPATEVTLGPATAIVLLASPPPHRVRRHLRSDY